MGCTTRCNTSVLVDDILFDIGMGTVKQIERLKITALTLKHGECIPINGYILER